MKKEKILIHIFLGALAAIILTASPAFSIEGPKNGKLLFSYEDDKYDDYGPGSYVYPNGKLFKSNPHMFDIASVKIYEVDEFYRFDVEYKGKIVRSWPEYMGYGNGWILNIAEIYIDRDHKWGSGHKNAALGRNLKFTPESAWDRVVFLSPVASDDMVSAIRDKTDDLEFAESLNDFVFPTSINVYDYTLSATVRKSDLGEFSKKWGIQVLSTVLDPSSDSTTFYNQRIYKTATDKNFGGSTDLYGAPNILDMITPKGVSQK
ncbi:MAG TPA: glucodextranase DOMON-like domain-containing protein, partial [Candidatus Wallbacteria bacterium]|nr:glucodextranase DOMON-like domain-containing protein [Candidatus Wallbacteria bacterium]